ncbi:hypothetical protein Theos_1692 [Thermus oshimai JL-2]|uniref:Uncharacterized protein n=1 Tax=Thermus oshimai JL-2 TaxID=751945 RepID=K7R0C4_THEOS|nr:hypothetical protein [Thermus oshimai]AFV76715.1 hypothetical protein Theos_1692 [Thermus oshimai JL-2]
MRKEFEPLLQNLTLKNWAERREEVFEALVQSGAGAVEVEEVLKAVARTLEVRLGALRQEWQDYLGPAPQKAQNAAGVAVKLALEKARLWKAPSEEAWATLEVDGHLEHHPLRGRAFRNWLGRLYYQEAGKPLYAQALQDALTVLEAQALYEGEGAFPVHTRLAEHGGKVYLDLARPDWSVVEVGPEGWRVIPSGECPVRFRRTPHQRPLPLPERREGALEALKALLPLREERDWALVLGWAVGALNPKGPYPVLVLTGEKGAGKSTVARLLKALLDPTEAPLRAEPKGVEDLMIAAQGNLVLALDNLSGIPGWLSDALCRLSTGGGLSKRQLYTDADEVVLDAKRPVVLNGIPLGTGFRDDLADRTALVHLDRIEDGARRPESELWAEFERWHPALLALLLDGVSAALRNWEAARKRLTALPRLADWAVWAEAAAPALGLEAGAVVEAFYRVQGELSADLLDGDPVAQAVLRLTQAWTPGQVEEYTAGELYRALEEAAGLQEARVKPQGWPRGAKGLARHLPRLQSALRHVGLRLFSRRDPHAKQQRWVLEKEREENPQNPQNPQTGSSTAFSPAGFDAGLNPQGGAQIPQNPHTPPPAGFAGLPPQQIPQEIPQGKTPSRTEPAGFAGFAGIDSPPPSKTLHPTPEGGWQPLRRVEEGEEVV